MPGTALSSEDPRGNLRKRSLPSSLLGHFLHDRTQRVGKEVKAFRMDLQNEMPGRHAGLIGHRANYAGQRRSSTKAEAIYKYLVVGQSDWQLDERTGNVAARDRRCTAISHVGEFLGPARDRVDASEGELRYAGIVYEPPGLEKPECCGVGREVWRSEAVCDKSVPPEGRYRRIEIGGLLVDAHVGIGAMAVPVNRQVSPAQAGNHTRDFSLIGCRERKRQAIENRWDPRVGKSLPSGLRIGLLSAIFLSPFLFVIQW